MEMQDILTTVGGEPITVADVIVHLKCDGAFRNAIYQLIEARVIIRQCKELGIVISDHEFHAHIETKRRLLGLASVIDLNRHCRWHDIVLEQWHNNIQQELLRHKLRDKIISCKDVKAYYKEHKNDFMMASVSRLVCPDYGSVEQAKQRIIVEGEDFAPVARKVSLEKNTRIAGGYLGSVKYGSLPYPINKAVFSADPGSVLGPFEQGGYWVLYRLEERRNTELDEALHNNIANRLFNQWLQKFVLSTKA
jgi:hypothetical protein